MSLHLQAAQHHYPSACRLPNTECTCRLPSIKMADLDRFDSALNTMERTKVPLTASVLRGVLLSAGLTGKPGQCHPLFYAPQLMCQQRV